jgi:hypothetical protein
VTSCVSGEEQDSCVPGTPAAEVCDGIDNDCNGTADNDIPLPSPVADLAGGKTGTDTDLAWSPSADTTGYDVVKGTILSLLVGAGDFTASTTACLGDDIATTTTTDTDLPAADDGFWYLVRSVNSCSGNGTYDEGGTQIESRDAEIDAAASTCP